MKLSLKILTLGLGALLLAITLIALMTVQDSRRENESLTARVAALELELENAKRELQQAPAISAQTDSSLESSLTSSLPVTSAVITPAAMEATALVDNTTSEADAQRATEWKAQFYVSEISRLVALTPEQERELKARYQDAFVQPGTRPAELYRDLLEQTLGAEIAQTWRAAEEAEDQRRESDALDDEIFSLSRKLALTPAQESAVKEALQSVQTELRPITREVQSAMREAMSNHSGADQDQARLRLSYDQLKALSQQQKLAKDELLSAKLRNLISEEQYNSLLALQASEPSRF